MASMTFKGIGLTLAFVATRFFNDQVATERVRDDVLIGQWKVFGRTVMHFPKDP
jgi:hypothetical protein